MNTADCINLANDLSAGTGPVNGGGGTGNTAGSSGSSAPGSTSSISGTSLSTLSLDHQQFNIFPAIFSRQLNFSAAAAANCGQNKLMDELRPNLGLLGAVNLMENEVFHLNHSQEKRKCSSASSNEQDFGLYGVHQAIEASSPTSAVTSGRNSVSASSSVGKYAVKKYFQYLIFFYLIWNFNHLFTPAFEKTKRLSAY